MYEVRYYKKHYHPSQFRGLGWRGLLVRALNWVRWKLEIAIHKQVLLCFLARDKVRKEEAEKCLKQLSVDLRKNSIDKTQEEIAPTVHFGDLDIEQEEYTPHQANGRPTGLESLASKYGENKRAKRYARGRKGLWARDDAFEAMEVPNEGKT